MTITWIFFCQDQLFTVREDEVIYSDVSLPAAVCGGLELEVKLAAGGDSRDGDVGMSPGVTLITHSMEE